MRKIPLLYLLLFTYISAAAQRDTLSPSMPFFEQKMPEYQHWLEAKGFDKVLKTERVRLKLDRNHQTDSTEIELFLLFTANNPDTAMAQWTRLKKDFDTDADSLEAILFRTFIHKMEMPETQGNIQIYVRDTMGNYVRNYHIFIWSEDGKVKSQNVGKSRFKSFEISIPYKIATTGKGKASKVPAAKRRSPDMVFNLVLQQVQNTLINHPRYREELDDRRPKIESDSTRTANTFKFTVADMGKEVLTDQERSIWEPWVGINTIAMERLTFSFEYNPAADGGYSLKCVIDGKFGSGVFKPRTSGYMNMEPDFDDFFEKYKNDFRLRLLNMLQQQP